MYRRGQLPGKPSKVATVLARHLIRKPGQPEDLDEIKYGPRPDQVGAVGMRQVWRQSIRRRRPWLFWANVDG
jgi:hypothetical protein